jgi:aspartyl-tRNA(Asn)/glutamyl-tRNA(Gln) amidotransferase subunit A
MFDPCGLSAVALLAAYASKRVSPLEVMTACLTRIDRFNPLLNAFVAVVADTALEEARASSARWAAGKPKGMLDGVPVAVKDLLWTKGIPTLRGSFAVDENQTWDQDAPCVARLREQGAIIIGKTATAEYGWKGVTDSLRHGVTRNPWDPDRTPGGSSGGSAVAVLGRMAPLAIGTDGGGSIRIPAAFTGTVGFKPTFGRVPAFPLSPVGTIAHLGPITRTVEDAALMMEVIGRADARDWYALPRPPKPFWPLPQFVRQPPRVAVVNELWGCRADASVERVFWDAIEAIAKCGVEVVHCEPDWPDIRETFRIHWQSGAANALRSLPLDRQERIESGLLKGAREGGQISLAQFQRAVSERERFGTTLNLFFEEYDFLLTPATATVAFPVGQENPSRSDDSHWLAWAHFSFPFNLSRNPALSIPAGLSTEGLPVGLQIVGALYEDQALLEFAARVEGLLEELPIPGLTPLAAN